MAVDKTDAELLALVKEQGAELLDVDPDSITPESRFQEDLDADSLDLVELVMAIEEALDIEIAEDDLKGIKTVGEAIELVKKQ